MVDAGGVEVSAADDAAEVDETSATPTALIIKDDETQSYDLTADDDGMPKEGAMPITVTLTANPAHVNGSATLALQLDAPRTIASLTGPETAHPRAIATTVPRPWSPSPWERERQEPCRRHDHGLRVFGLGGEFRVG